MMAIIFIIIVIKIGCSHQLHCLGKYENTRITLAFALIEYMPGQTESAVKISTYQLLSLPWH